MASNKEKACLTSDCGGVDKNGPGRFRTEANHPDKKVRYLYGQNNNQMFNVFTCTSKSAKNEKDIYCQSDRARSNKNTHLKHVVTAKWRKQW